MFLLYFALHILLTVNTLKIKSLTLSQIDASTEIQRWLQQFSDDQKIIATNLLLKLKFVSRDSYSLWLKDKLAEIADERLAVYSVRKLELSNGKLWDGNGNVVARPATSLGSEDLVYSIISGFCREKEYTCFEHPSIVCLRNERIKRIVLVDDSIGSGQRVIDFMKAMLLDDRFKKTFLSWLSYNLINFTVIAFARETNAERMIRDNLPGSDHGIRHHRKSSKMKFISEVTYNGDHSCPK